MKPLDAPQNNLDLFGQPVPTPQPIPVEDKKYVAIRERVFLFFHDRKYQSFTVKELQTKEELARIKPASLRRAIDQLMKSRKILGTGELRGPGQDNLCLTLNLHKPKR